MIEVEVKIVLESEELLLEKLEALGFETGYLIQEDDLYFNSSFFDLRKQDMALRIRSSENLTLGTSESFLTYKGPKLDTISMTRKELEMTVESGTIGKEILTSIGYDLVYPVKKLRQYYYKDELTACVDKVEGLGTFLELEMLVSEEEKREQALETIIQFLGKIGYKKENIIRTSYLSMLQQK